MIIQEETKERTVTEIQEDNTLRNEEEDTTATPEPAPTENISKVSSPHIFSLPEQEIFYNIMHNPFLNLTTSPPPPPFTPTASQMTTSLITSTIMIASIPPLPPTKEGEFALGWIICSTVYLIPNYI